MNKKLLKLDAFCKKYADTLSFVGIAEVVQKECLDKQKDVVMVNILDNDIQQLRNLRSYFWNNAGQYSKEDFGGFMRAIDSHPSVLENNVAAFVKTMNSLFDERHCNSIMRLLEDENIASHLTDEFYDEAAFQVFLRIIRKAVSVFFCVQYKDCYSPSYYDFYLFILPQEYKEHFERVKEAVAEELKLIQKNPGIDFKNNPHGETYREIYDMYVEKPRAEETQLKIFD